MRLFFFAIFLLLIEIYAYQAFRTATQNKYVRWVYLIVSLFVLVYFIHSLYTFDRSLGQTNKTLYAFGIFLTFLIPKLLLTVMMLGEDIFRFTESVFKRFVFNSGEERIQFLVARRKFLSQLALGAAALSFISVLYGIIKGKYDFRILKHTLYFDDLPETFDGFVIKQISDLHSGSFDNKEKIKYGVQLIDSIAADLMVFTGDIVNTRAEEMHPWIEMFAQIQTPTYGKFAVLGNHDYGEYVSWPSQAHKEDNFNAIKKLYAQIGHQLLLNEHVFIEKNGARLALVGVENWGRNFKQAGDLELASAGLTEKDFKILLSHDPSHWDEEVKNHPKNFQLTLSGHTHGLQFGIEIPGFLKWSPVQYVYKQWAGIYAHHQRLINVNRGFGFHAYSGRVGIWPEITEITLRRKEL
ncbi:MAG: metallophosphoesterase [Flavobacteriaceae bacterium]|nr:metallophosphoesterase [Flavobacteriaceae bacterium]